MQKRDIAILDFGSEKITVVIGTKDVNNTFVVRGKGESDYAGFMDAEFLEPEKLKIAMGDAIANAEEDANVQIKKLYIGVPAEFCYCVCKNVSENSWHSGGNFNSVAFGEIVGNPIFSPYFS